jgi:hypothetical protein
MYNEEYVNNLISIMRETDTEIVEKYTKHKDFCKECKGLCCRQCGCRFTPEQFRLTKATDKISKKHNTGIILLALNTNLVSLIYSEDTDSYFLRSRHKNSPVFNRINNPGRCVMLTDHGCILPDEYRPHEGLFTNCSEVPFNDLLRANNSDHRIFYDKDNWDLYAIDWDKIIKEVE